jgi:hypothetical protein
VLGQELYACWRARAERHLEQRVQLAPRIAAQVGEPNVGAEPADVRRARAGVGHQLSLRARYQIHGPDAAGATWAAPDQRRAVVAIEIEHDRLSPLRDQLRATAERVLQ